MLDTVNRPLALTSISSPYVTGSDFVQVFHVGSAGSTQLDFAARTNVVAKPGG